MSVSLTDNCEEEEREEEQEAGVGGRARKKEVMKVSDITEKLFRITLRLAGGHSSHRVMPSRQCKASVERRGREDSLTR